MKIWILLSFFLLIKGAVSVDANITEANTATVNVTIDGILLSSSVPAAWDTTIYPDGPPTAGIYVTDTASNTAAASVSVTVDNTPPAVSLTSPANNSALRGIVDITADIHDTYLANTSITINGTAISNTSCYSWNTTAYPDGWYNITATAADMAENTGRHEIWVEVDNTPPELSVNELNDNPTLTEPQYRINGTVEAGAILTINGNLTSHSGTFAYTTNVTEGTNTITVTATDAGGNTATWTKTRMVDTDLLPDYYELNVTGTDPLDGDSDSSLTPENEAGNGITDDMETFGSDNLPTLINMRIGTDPLKEDTDADGLTDEFELLKLGLLTDPLSGTTDGIQDTEADLDQDGLTNLEEQTYGTDPLVPDTDGDGLTDKEEITAGSDPLNKDTDGDGLEDGSEILLGTDPNNPDSDGDGLADSVETYAGQNIENELATLQIDGVGDVTRTTNVTDASGYVVLAEMAGSTGNIVDVNTSSQFTSATITIPYNETDLNGASENDLKMYYLNEADHSITFLDVPGVDTVNNVVRGETDHFSTFGIVSYKSYTDVWNSGSNPTPLTSPLISPPRSSNYPTHYLVDPYQQAPTTNATS